MISNLLNKKGFRIYVNLILLLLCILSLLYSANHYADGGCDGGLCGIAVLIHGLPLLISWIFLIVSANFCISMKKIFFVLLILSSIPNFWILSLLNVDYGYSEKALYNPSYLILTIQGILIVFFFYLINQKKESTNLF